MTRRIALFGLLLFAAIAHAAGPATRPTTSGAARPNVLLIVADDLCWRDTGFSGNPDVHTPNLDRLRSQGMYLRRMYSPAATCTPTRSALYTGLYGVRSGAYPNHSDVRTGTRSLFTEMKAAGYRVGLQNKSDVRPADSFPFEHFDGVDDLTAATAFVTRRADQPWLLVFGSDDPHNPWNRGDAKAYDPAKLTLWPYLHDDRVTRRRLAAYYAEITDLDAQVGRLLAMIDATGQADRTMVVFVSEQGSSLPFAGKWTLYDTGVRGATLVRWPGVVKENSTSDAIAQYVDLTPTFLAAAGVDPTAVNVGCPDAQGHTGFDGRNLMDVLTGKTDTFRDAAYAQHTALGVFGIEGPVPLRCVVEKKYHYVRNFNPGQTFMMDGYKNSPVLNAWRQAAEADPKLAARVDLLVHPPAEALFDLEADPFELDNRAADPALADVKAGLSRKLDAWMAQQGDRGLATEREFKIHMKSAGE